MFCAGLNPELRPFTDYKPKCLLPINKKSILFHNLDWLERQNFKNVTLIRDGKTSEFPDAITTRGSKHIKTLMDAHKKGYECYVLFLVQIENCKYFRIAKDIDNEYYENYKLAKKSGVKFIAYNCKVGSKEIKIDKKIEILDE